MRRYRALADTDISRPDGVPWRPYLKFVRAVATCVLRGHVEPKMLHKIDRLRKPRRDGGVMQVTLREACGRCGLPFSEKVSKGKAVMPRRDELDSWRLN